jgi:serine/threonine protein kinase
MDRPQSSTPAAGPATDAAIPERMGTTLDHFELLDCIGAGGMGRVFRANDTRLSRLVAVKVLDPELAKDPEICRRFQQEARSAARLDSPHFARVYFCGHDKGVHYIAMEFVEGETLREKIARLGRLDVGLVIDVGMQVARGLEHAVRSSVVHRDIKPSNIIVTPHGEAKLVDMGLARTILHRSAGDLTHPGITLGTFDYISPEQARDPREVDVRSDIYSLGCTLYHALVGRPPFPEGSGLQKLLQHQSESVPDPRRFVRELPGPLVAVLLRMLAKDPRDRYQTPTALLSDLHAVAELLGLALRRQWSEFDGPAMSESHWDRQLVWAAPTALLVGAILLYSFIYRSRPVTPPVLTPSFGPAAAATRMGPATESSASTAGASPSAAPAKPAPVKSPSDAVGSQVVTIVEDTRQLVDAIAQAPSGSTIVLSADTYVLNPGEGSAPFLGNVQDKVLTMRARATGGLVTLRVAPIPLTELGGRQNPLVRVAGKSRLTLERIKLEVARPLADGARVIPAPIVLESGELTVRECDLGVATDMDWNVTDAALIVVGANSRATDRCQLEIAKCHFAAAPTADAVRITGAAQTTLKMHDCAIRPMRSPVRIDAQGKVEVTFEHTSTLIGLGSGPVFRIADIGDVSIFASNSVFSHVSGTSAEPLVRVVGSTVRRPGDGPWWTGSQNIYHGFDGRFLSLGERTIASLQDAKNEPGFRDATTREYLDSETDSWVWAHFGRSDPVARSLDEANPARIFQLAPSIEENWRRLHRVAPGIRSGPWGPMYATEPIATAAANRPPAEAQRTRSEPVATRVSAPRLIVNPNPVGAQDKGDYKDLSAAAIEVGAGQPTFIELRSDQEVAVENIRVDEDKDLSIEPAQGSRPKLLLRVTKTTTIESGRLFRIKNRARLKLRGIPIVVDLTESTADAVPIALFECAEGSTIELQDVSIQVRNAAGARQFAVFSIQAPTRGRIETAGMPVTMPVTGAAAAVVRLSRCEMRTAGSLLAAEPHVLWSLAAGDCFVAAAQPAVHIAGPTMDLGNAPQPSQITLDRSTLMLRDSLITVDVAGARPNDPRIIDVRATQTALIGLGTEALSRSAGNHRAVFQRDAIRWTATKLFIAGFSTLFRYAGEDSGAMPTNEKRIWTFTEWLKQRGLTSSECVYGPETLPSHWIRPLSELIVPTNDQWRELNPGSDGELQVGVDPRVLPTPGS